MQTRKILFKSLGTLMAVAMLMAFLPAGEVMAETTLCVNEGGTDGCFASIQAAIDAASDGDTINVYPGTYVEGASGDAYALEMNVANLTLQSSEGRDVTVIDAGGATTGVWVLKDLGEVVFDGFTVENFTENGVVQSYTQRQGTAFHILNSLVDSSNGYLRNGLQVSGDGSTVIGNIVYGAPLADDWASTGIGVINANNVIVRGNTVQQDDEDAANPDIGVNVMSYSAIASNVTVEQNTLINSGDGVRISAGDPSYVVQNVIIDENVLEGNTWGINVQKVTLDGVTITDNSIQSNSDDPLDDGPLPGMGIRFSDESALATNISISGNTFSDNETYQIFGHSGAMIDVPAVLSANTFDKAVYIDGQPVIYSSIQSAINAASDGDTIEVSPGTYIEGTGGEKALDLTVANLTVRSTDGRDVTIIDANEATTGVWVNQNLGTVTFDGFTVKNFVANGVVQSRTQRDGTAFHILNNLVVSSDGYLRNGLQVSGNGSTVIGNIVYGAPLTVDWSSTGIGVVDATNAVVKDNIVDQNEGEGTFPDIGINVMSYDYETSNITVENNVVSNAGDGVRISAVDRESPTPPAVKNVTITGNTLSDNTWGINVQKAVLDDVTITNNTIQSNYDDLLDDDGPLYGSGIRFSDESATVTNASILGNTFSDNETYQVFGHTGALIDVPAVLSANTFDNAVTIDGDYVIYSSIQDAIDDASDGDTINVAAGTYEEGITQINKDLTIIGDETDKPVIKPTEDTGTENVIGDNGRGWYQIHDGANVTFKNLVFDGTGKNIYTALHYHGDSTGGLVENCDIKNIKHSQYQGRGINNYGQNLEVKGCTFENIERIGVFTFNSTADSYIHDNIYTGKGDGDNLNYGFEIGGGAKATIEHNTIQNVGISTTQWLNSGVLITDAYPTNGSASVVIQHNDIINNDVGIVVGYDDDDGSEAVIEYNNFTGTTTAVSTSDELPVTPDASPNWFGSINGPAAGQIVGNVTYSPWCGDAECSFLVYEADTSTSDAFQDSIASTSPGGTLYVPSNPPVVNDGYTVGGITLILGDGVTIQNNSPCFVVDADHTKVTTETIGGAVCVPTNNDHGIVVNGGLTDIIIEGLEIDGTDQNTGNGIHFAGAITDVILRDNFIHDLDGDGVEFTVAEPAGTVQIQGNLFKDNTGNGIEAGSFTIPAEYNAWGSYDGPETANGGDGISAGVDAEPWTHVSLSLADTGSTLFEDEVLVTTHSSYDTITYEVKADLKNATGADFKLSFDPALLEVKENGITLGDVFTVPATGSDVVTYDNDAGVIHFAGVPAGGTEQSGTDLTLFTVTFTGKAAGVSALAFGEDEFAMSPPSGGPSNNIYAAALVDGSVTVRNHFTVTGTVSMQGRTERAGVEMTLTAQNYGYGPFSETSTSTISNNLTLLEVVEDEYQITITQDRYLDVTVASGKTVDVTDALALNPIELKGGDVNNSNDIGLGDASVVGTFYGTGTIADAGDANFDGRVNIQDLALVGGNYELQSSDPSAANYAYGTWTP